MATTVQTVTPIVVVQGEDRELTFGLKDSSKEVYIDLLDVTAIVLKVEATAGGSVEFSLSSNEIEIANPLTGKFKVNISDSKSALMKLGKRFVEVVIDWGDKRRIIQMNDALNIVAKKLV